MNLKSTQSALEDVYHILGGYGFAAMDKAATEMELTPDLSTWLFAIWLFSPESITTANFMRMFPYGLAHLNKESFASAIQHGYLINVKATKPEGAVTKFQVTVLLNIPVEVNYYRNGGILHTMSRKMVNQKPDKLGYLATTFILIGEITLSCQFLSRIDYRVQEMSRTLVAKGEDMFNSARPCRPQGRECTQRTNLWNSYFNKVPKAKFLSITNLY